MDDNASGDFFQSMPSATTWQALWAITDRAEDLDVSFESSLPNDVLEILRNNTTETGIAVTCDRCQKTLLGLQIHCSQCPDFDVCASCYESELNKHVQWHNFQFKHHPCSLPPPDGADFDGLHRLKKNEANTHGPETQHIARLGDEVKCLSGTVRQSYLSAEIERATNWRKLNSLYSRFENCVSVLAAEVRASGIPVPPAIATFQKFLEKNWNTGNAKEASFYAHQTDFEKADYSHEIDKKKLGEVLQKFVGEFILPENLEDSSMVYSGHSSDLDLPPTPIETKNEIDGSLELSAITVEGTSQRQWEYLKPRNEFSLGKDMRDFHDEVLKIASLFGRRPDLWCNNAPFTITLKNDGEVAAQGNVLHRGRRYRRVGRFADALETLSEDLEMRPDITFERFCVFEEMGDLRGCIDCAEAFSRKPQDPGQDANETEQFLLRLAAAYVACFAKGEWENAMTMALIAYDNYLAGTASYDTTLTRIELYYHKIWLAISRDFGATMVYSETSKRLMKLREALQAAALFTEAYEVLLMELELVKEPKRHSRAPSYWSGRYFNDFVDVPRVVCERVWSYLEAVSKGSDGHSPVVEEAHCHLRLSAAFREAATTARSFKVEMEFNSRSAFHRKEALSIYDSCGSQLGLSDVALLDLKREDQFDIKDDVLAECDRICSLFKDLNSLKGQLEALLWKAEFLHTYFRDTVTGPYTQLEHVARTAGNLYQWHLCRLLKLQWWLTSTSLVDDSRLIFQAPRGFVSAKLGSIASLNLSNAFRTIGDYEHAEVAAFFHLLFVSCCEDNDHVYASLINLIHIQSRLTVDLPQNTRQEIFSSWMQGWLQILVNINTRAVELIFMGWRARTYDITKIAELVLLLPRMGTDFDTELQTRVLEIPPAFHVYVPLLDLGLGLLELLPTFFWPVSLSQFGLTLGIVSERSENFSLALRAYQQSLVANHPGNGVCANYLKQRIGGTLMKISSVTYHQREPLVVLAMKAFAQAESFYWRNTHTDEDFKYAVLASISLASCALSVIRRTSSKIASGENGVAVQFCLNRAVELCTTAMKRSIGQWQCMRRELIASLKSDTLRHQRSYLTGNLSRKLLTTQYDIAITLTKIKITAVEDLWLVVQQWKAISLSDLLVASHTFMPEPSTLDPHGRSLVEEERRLVDNIRTAQPYDRPKLRMELRLHWLHMSSHAELAALSTLRLGMGANFSHLREIQKVSQQFPAERESIVFVDWAHQGDDIFLFVIQSVLEEQTILFKHLGLLYSDVEKWATQNLRDVQDSGTIIQKRLEKAADMETLSPLIDPLRDILKGDELLVLCPTGVLNEIPLHAIPFKGTSDPLLANNPIVYSSSPSITKSCVDAAFQKVNSARASTKFIAFGRFGDLDISEAALIDEMVKELADKFRGIHVTGNALSREVFKEKTSDADFIHYHGHATCERDTSIRSLVFEPKQEFGDDGKFTVDDVFQLQLQSAHVTLLACASGEQRFSFNDDPVGIVTAFLCAGATSVLGTLWPTDCRDARAFSDEFYENVHLGNNGIIHLARATQKTVMELRDFWGCDGLYHWAQFVLYGSWFCAS